MSYLILILALVILIILFYKLLTRTENKTIYFNGTILIKRYYKEKEMNPRLHNSSSYSTTGKRSSRSGVSYSIPKPEEFRVIILSEFGTKFTINDPLIFQNLNQGMNYKFSATKSTTYLTHWNIELHHSFYNIKLST